MKQLDFEKFFFKPKIKMSKNSRDNALGATILLTPNQSINVYNVADNDSMGNLIDGLGTHILTYDKLLAYIYGLDYDSDDVDYLEFILDNYNKNYLVDYIHISLVSDYYSTSFIINSPKYITNYEYHELVSLNEYLKRFSNIKFSNIIFINGYDPVNNSYDDTKEFKTIDSLINYYKNNNLIKDYLLKDNSNNIIDEKIYKISDKNIRK